ncbi:MAG: serine--tRNA ligase [Planctomycetia bacterium]|nr:serine--tRNA ligase [Planctomycetia bacterium]
MLDRKYIVENAAAVKQNCVNRGVEADVDRLVSLEAKRRELLNQSQELNRQANEVSKTIGQAKDAAERESRKEAGRKEITKLQAGIPNLSHPDAPIGEDDKSNLEIRVGKHAPPKFDFIPLDHVDLAEKLDLIDFEGGARVAGAGFYFLKNDAVLLELALQQYALRMLIGEGFTPVTTPDLAYTEILHGTGYIPRGPETQIYSIENSNLNLVATAEITIGGLLAGQIVNAEQLPLKICGSSHCFRTEADHFCELEGRIFDGLGIPYRVVDTATGDLGGPAYRKFDLEAWMPGRGEYGEVTSTSNCTDYQSRRLNVRFRRKGEKGTSFVHTLNGTALAISRALIAVLENNQRADGSINVPEALRAWMGKDTISVGN